MLSGAAALVACDDPIQPPSGERFPPVAPSPSTSGSSTPSAPGSFTVTLGVDPFNATHPLPAMAEPMMFKVVASGTVSDKRCTTIGPLTCTAPMYDAGGWWYSGTNYGKTYIQSPYGNPVNIGRSADNSTPDSGYIRIVTVSGNGLVGRGVRDNRKCGNSSGFSPCAYDPTGSHTFKFTPTHETTRDLKVDSSLVNPRSHATFKVTNVSGPDRLVRLLNWVWVPDEGASVELTNCPLGDVHKYATPECSVPIYSSGTMYTRTKTLGGVVEQQDARVDVRTLTIKADRKVADVGETVTFTAYFGDTPAPITRWRWSGDTQDSPACAGASTCAKLMTEVGEHTMTGYVDDSSGTVLQSAQAVVGVLEKLCEIGDGLGDHPVVREAMARVLGESNLWGDLKDRREVVAIIYDSSGTLFAHYPVLHTSTPCSATWDFPPPRAGIIFKALIHSHPFEDRDWYPISWPDCKMKGDPRFPARYERSGDTGYGSGTDWNNADVMQGIHYILDHSRVSIIDNMQPPYKGDIVRRLAAPGGTLIVPVNKSRDYREVLRGNCPVP